MDKSNPFDQLTDQVEKAKAGIRIKVEHPLRVIKRQFGYIKTRYRELQKNTALLVTLFTLSNLWMVRTKCKGRRDECAYRQGKWCRPWPTEPEGAQKSLSNCAH